ncbi:MAG: hypothetical protein JWN52_4966 [Actinomycetia bacterium]|nr:hypothetical protein [Actinomycetes bacterium]
MIRQRLDEVAAQAPPLRTSIDQVRRQIRRKRKLRLVATATGSAVAAGVIGSIWIYANPGEDKVSVASGRSTTASRSPKTTSVQGGGVNEQDGGPSLRCGDRITVPTIRTGRYGIALQVQRVKKAADGSPVVTVALTSTEPIELAFGRHSAPFRLLILKNGQVVAGQDAPPRQHPAWMPANGRVTPTRPYVEDTRPASSTPCQGQSWPALWAHPGGYNIVVLADANAFARVDVAASKRTRGIGFAPGQYLLAQGPLPSA